MSNLADLLSGQGKNWVADRPPLSEIEIEAAKRRIGRQLPPTLLELYRLCDGGQGSLPETRITLVCGGLKMWRSYASTSIIEDILIATYCSGRPAGACTLVSTRPGGLLHGPDRWRRQHRSIFRHIRRIHCRGWFGSVRRGNGSRVGRARSRL